jgi:flagellar protein FliS
MSFGAKQYKKAAITTVSKGQVLILLYEGALQNVKGAIHAIETNNVQKKGICVGKIHDIINELVNTLDFKVGGQIAVDLDRLYTFMIEQLVRANIENSVEKLQSIERLLNTLLDGWRVAVQEYERGAQR